MNWYRQVINTFQKSSRWRWIDVFVVLGLIVLAYFVVSFRIDRAPDIFTDEIIYTRIGIRVGGEGALVWDSGEAFVVHPPLYFILEGLYFALTGSQHFTMYNAGDIFAAVQHARHLNALVAGFTVAVFYLMGKKLHNRWLGFWLAAIFLLDPFGVRINRRAMLETMAGFFTLTALYIYLVGYHQWQDRIARTQGNRRYLPFVPGLILAGITFGAALLTKEIVFPSIMALVLFGLIEAVYVGVHKGKRFIQIAHLLPSLFVGFIAAITYLIYPFWVYLNGDWQTFSGEKFLGLRRLLGLVQLTGWNRPGLSLLDFLSERLVDYGSSYILLGLGGVTVAGLLFWGLNKPGGRLLVAIGLIQYPFFAYLTLAGSGNDQFYYFLLLVAVLLVGYGGATLPAFLPRVAGKLLPLSKVRPAYHPRITRGSVFFATAALPALLVLFIPFNLYRWWDVFISEYDNGYANLANYVATNLPPGAAINASGDPIKFRYFLPDHSIFALATPFEAEQSGVEYFALVPKDVQFRYGNIQPELATWIMTHGKLLFMYDGDSYGEIYLYHVDQPGEALVQTDEQLFQGGAHWRSFQPARSGQIDILLLLILLFLLFWGGLSVVSHVKHHQLISEQPQEIDISFKQIKPRLAQDSLDGSWQKYEKKSLPEST